MQRRGRRGSGNVEDRRRIGGRDVAIGGMGGVAGIIVLLLITFMDGDPSSMLNTKPQRSSATPEQEDELKQSSSVVLADTEDVWRRQYRKIGRTYREPRSVLFGGYAQSACGTASSSTGPFYCSAGERVYVDLGFFAQLGDRFGAPSERRVRPL